MIHEIVIAAISATSNGNLDERLAVAFDMYDISHDGHIDQSELTKMISATYDLAGEKHRTGENDPKRRAVDIIEKLDVEGDKRLSREEFITGLKNDPYMRKLLVPNA